jgi:putative transposase
MKLRKTNYKLYPGQRQSARLLEVLRLQQQLYNAALQERIDCYRKTGKSISYNHQQASLTQIRADHPEYKAVPVYISRMTLRRLDKAFKAFFSRVKKGQAPGFPRFRSLSRFSSFEMCAGSGWTFTPGDKNKHGRLFIRSVGHIKARGKARTLGTVKASQVVYRHGQWFLSVTYECHPERLCKGQKACGFDWGVEYLGSLAHENGDTFTIENPRYFRNSKEGILALEQAVARKKRGANRWRRACKTLSEARSKLVRQRHHDHHQLSHDLAETYTLFATEELTIRNMTRTAKGTVEKPGRMVKQKSGLNREILDTAPAKLLAMIRYKVEETGGEFVEIPTRKAKPSQRCPACWAVAKKTLSDRTHQCDCGCTLPRDAASGLVAIQWALGLGRNASYAGHSAKPIPSKAWCR